MEVSRTVEVHSAARVGHLRRLCRKLHLCRSRGILLKPAQIFESTECHSKRLSPSSRQIRLHASMMTPTIRSASFARSSLAFLRRGGYSWSRSLSVARRCESSTLALRTLRNERDMKKPSDKRPQVSERAARVRSQTPVRRDSGDELRPHYDFDYSKSRPNRFATRSGEGAVAVVLDPDVAAVFRTSEAVNTFLRSAISAMPQDAPAKKRRAS